MKTKLILVLIILLAFILRFYNLDKYPALNADEAAIGYNAYSLIKTGMDEHGHSWPITFQSFNDYKPGLYFYIVLPFVKMLGLNEWSVRIPCTLFGVLSVYVIYPLCNELFNDKKYKIFDLDFGIWPAFMLAISPWHIHFSRGAWEVNTAAFFVLSGILFLFKAFGTDTKKYKNVNLAVSAIFMVASLYTYHAARVIVPLIGLLFVAIYWKTVIGNLKQFIFFVLLGGILLIPLIINLMSPGALSRVAGVGLFADQGPLNRINEQRGEHGDVKNVFGKIEHNKVINYGLAFLSNWTTHYNGEFLFMSGDSIQRNKVPETGVMYLFDILFLTIGFIGISRNFDKGWKFIIGWLIIAPIASALTFQSPNSLRSQNMVIPVVIVSAFGLTRLIEFLKNCKINKSLIAVCYLLLATIIVWNFTRYLEMYWNHMSKEYPYSSQYGLRELVTYVSENKSRYSDIFITNRYDQPYILFLFYMKYSPSDFQGGHTLTSRDDFGFSTVAGFDKFHFEPIDYTAIQNNYPNSLIIGTTAEIPQSANIIKRIYGSNGFEYFDIVQN